MQPTIVQVLGNQQLCKEKLLIFQMKKATNSKNKGKISKLFPVMQEHPGKSMNLARVKLMALLLEAPVKPQMANERASSHLYVKSFIGKDGKKRYYFKSVTVKRGGLEVNVSSHFDRPKRLREA